MKRTTLLLLALLPLVLASGGLARAHCEVPCGIYNDPARFTGMLEDATTISKAMHQIQDLAGKNDAASLNQLVRWVNTKEAHAVRTMETIGQYFMAQRIKQPKAGSDPSDGQRYVKLLKTAHGVTLAAMMCKRSVDTAHADALTAAIKAFQTAYDEK